MSNSPTDEFTTYRFKRATARALAAAAAINEATRSLRGFGQVFALLDALGRARASRNLEWQRKGGRRRRKSA